MFSQASANAEGDWFTERGGTPRLPTGTGNLINKRKDRTAREVYLLFLVLPVSLKFARNLWCHTLLFPLLAGVINYAEPRASRGCRRPHCWIELSTEPGLASLLSPVWSFCCSGFSFMLLPFHLILLLYSFSINQRLAECSPRPFNYSY